MSSNPIKQRFSKNQLKILKLLLEKDYLQNELQEALKTTAPNLHYHLSRLESHNLIQKETLHEMGSAKINKISLNPSAREYVLKLIDYKSVKTIRNKSNKIDRSKYKSSNKVLKKIKKNSIQISVALFLLCLTGIIISSTLLFITPLTTNYDNSEFEDLTPNADIFTQTIRSNSSELIPDADIFTQTIKNKTIELTADADVFTQKTITSNITVYDGSGATPFLRLGLYDKMYETGGYLSEIYVRFNLPNIKNIISMILQLTYWEGYPIEVDDNYDVNVSLVSNDWVEGNTVWAERPEYLNRSAIVFLHNPSLESEVYLNLTSLVEGINESLITIHLCPNNLSRIRFPAPFYSSESYGITPKLVLAYGYPDYNYKWNKTWGDIYDDYVDTESAMAIDSSNNIYLVGRTDTTGTSDYDIMLIKYDSSGVEQWAKSWDGGGTDQGYSVLIDNADEIYVVGMTTSYADPDGDIVIIKFDSDGNQQWNFTWGGAELDRAHVIVKDSLNNYYIAGETMSFGDIDGDVILIKFDSNWIEQWNVTWGGSDEDYPVSMEIDSNGDIYIVGGSFSVDPSPGEADVMLLKYDASGTLIWDENWGGSWTQRGYGIAIDSNNNIYFVGWTFGHPASSMKSHLVKYDTNGNYQWERIWGVDGVYGNLWKGIIIDSNDEIFISGYTTTHGPYTGQGDVILLNYNTSGNQNWYKTWGMPGVEEANSINMDSRHNIYIAGITDSSGAGGYDIFIMKYLLEYEESSETQINVYDGSGATPFLRLGLYDKTYETGGYLSEIYIRFNLPKIENISSMILQFTYWEGYPIEADDNYDVNVSLVSNDWVEDNTVWTEKPEDLGTNTIVYLHNPSLESEVYLNLTNLVEGINESLITIHLCPNNLSRIRFPAPFYSSESYGITPKLILEYKEPLNPSINVYDYSAAIPFLRLGLYGGYLSEIYLRFNLNNIENINSMILELAYWEGYPIEADYYYEVNASLVRNNWVEETTNWIKKPEELGTSTLLYFHNPNLEKNIYLDLTNLVKGITETTITIHLCPYNLSRIRFPAPFESSESNEITPKLRVGYTKISPLMFPNTTHIVLIILLVMFGSLTTVTLSIIISKVRKGKIRDISAVITQEDVFPETEREKFVSNILEENSLSIKQEEVVSITKSEKITEEKISKEPKILEEQKGKLNLCSSCGASNIKGWVYCYTCGARMKPMEESVDPYEFIGGFIVSLIGGLASIALGIGLAFIYPRFVYFMGSLFIILQAFTIIGGIISVIGSIIVFFKPKTGASIILAGGIIAGINLIILIGASIIFRKLRN